MPAGSLPVFRQPTDRNTPVWRYMDFAKFVWMLEARALYFARSDQFGDPFEGSYSRANEKMRKVTFAGLPSDEQTAIAKLRGGHAKRMRRAIFINCWHMNEGESAAMWKLYAQTNEAVAVKSSFDRLMKVLDETVYVGVVDYIDFDKDWLREGNFFYPYVHKRESFAHEREVRAVTVKLPTIDGKPDAAAPQRMKGLKKSVSLEKLIEVVHVAPTCPKWFRILVERVAKRYALNVEVRRSSLDSEPFF